MLEVHDAHVLNNLILRNVGGSGRVGRGRSTLSSEEKEVEEKEEKEEKEGVEKKEEKEKEGEKEEEKEGEKKKNTILETPLKRKNVPSTTTLSIMSPTACFLNGFPGSPKPKPGTATRPLVFEDYLTDAHTQSVARMARMAVYWYDISLCAHLSLIYVLF